MNITLLSTSSGRSGGARQAVYLARYLHDAGHRVVFFTYPGSEIRLLDTFIEWRDLPKKLSEAEAELRSCIVLGEKNIIHAFHNKAVKLAAFFGTLWWLRGLPVACVAHRGVTARPNNPLPYLLPGIKAFIVNSKACAGQLPLLWRKHRCHVVWNSVPDGRLTPKRSKEEVLHELGIPHGKLVIGNICNENPAKGAPALLRLYADIRKNIPDSVLLIIGSSWENWSSICAELGLSKTDVHFIRTQDVADYLQLMSAFLFTSSFIESQPNVLLEAMSAGLPILANDVGGVSEIIDKKYLINVNDKRATAERVISFIQSSEEMALAGLNNKEFSRAFSTENRMQAILKIYKQAIGQ